MKWFGLSLFLFFTKANVGNTQGKNCSPKDWYHVASCTMHTFSKYECSESFLENQTIVPADIYQTNMTVYPGRPGSIRINLGYKLNKGKHVPEVNLSFTPPSDVSRKLVKGFEVTRHDILRTGPTVTSKCYIFVLSNVTWKGSSDEITMTFNLSLFPLNPNTRTMYFEVYTLPKYVKRDASTDVHQWTAVEIPPFNYSSYNSDVPTDDWMAAIFWTKLEKEGRILVYTSPPPLDITEMEYILVTSPNEQYVKRNQISMNEPNFTFNNVVTGNYTIMVKPIGPRTPNCVCNAACRQCITTQTSTFSFHIPTVGPSSTTATATTSPSTNEHNESRADDSSNDSNLHVTLSTLAVLTVGIFLGLFVIWHIQRCRRTKENKLQFEKRPKLFLLYEDDHEYHRKVVDKFASYLQLYCQCDVMCAEWQLDATWVHQDLQHADYVVIVNSEGAYCTYLSESSKLIMGNTQQMLYPKTKSILSINCVRNKFLREDRYDNIVMVYFEYTDERFVLPDISPGYKYQIPKHFTEFLLHIHKLHRSDNLAKYDLPLEGNYCLKPFGQEFVAALSQASRYQQDNPHWLVNRFHFDTLWSKCSGESQHDSGFPEEFTSFGQTSPAVSKEVNYANIMGKIKDYLDTTSQGAITINPSDITSRLDDLHMEHGEEMRLGKQGPMHSAAYFSQQSVVLSDAYSPASCDIDQCQFEFIPPDDIDNSDIISRSPSDQMKSLVDRYQNYLDLEVAPGQQNETAVTKGYNRNADLLLLNVQIGEVQLAKTDSVSLGGESV